MYQGPTGLDGARVLIKLFGESCSLSMESSGENLCVYGLGECPVMVIMGDKMKQVEQRGKVTPQDSGASAVSRMVQPLLRMNVDDCGVLLSFCADCLKRILEAERGLARLRNQSV